MNKRKIIMFTAVLLLGFWIGNQLDFRLLCWDNSGAVGLVTAG